MTHTFDTKNRVTSTSSPALCPITPTSGATLLVVGIVTHGSISRVGGAPTFNGDTLSIAHAAVDAIETEVEMYYLADPSIGTYNVIVPNTGEETLHIVASVYKAQAGYDSVFDVSNADVDTTADPSVSVTTTEDGDVIVDVIGNGYPNVPASGNQTLLYNTDNGVYTDSHQYALQSSAGLIEFSWDNWSDDWCMIVSAFKEVQGSFPSTNQVDGKVRILDKATSNADGKLVIGDSATNLADGKVQVKDVATNLVDGTLRVKDKITGIVDGKLQIKDTFTNMFDGVLRVKDVISNLVDGKAQVKDSLTNLFDGKVEITDNVTNLVDGKLRIKDAVTNLVDGKARVKDAVSDLVDGKLKITQVLGRVTNLFNGLLQIPEEYNMVTSSEEQHDITTSHEAQHNIVMIRDEE